MHLKWKQRRKCRAWSEKQVLGVLGNEGSGDAERISNKNGKGDKVQIFQGVQYPLKFVLYY